MDIHRWLEETAEAEAPEKPAETVASKFFYPPEQPKPVSRGKRTRQHTKSDSSILAPQPHPHKAPPKAPSPSAEDDTNASACSEASRSSHIESAGSDSNSHCYARRPRHKTHPERYEPKRSKESRKHVHPSRKDELKKSVSRSKSKKRKKTDSAAGRTFHAKNVSKDRLTLKPREYLGLFNKGKTSTAVRGRGLPDLVFSEMKFLQKEQPSPEPDVQEALPKKKRKKGHAQTKEGEISAYFTTARPPLAEKDNNVQSRPVQSVTYMGTRNRAPEQTQSRKSSDVVPTIETLDKGPYLGFGSRGPRHASTSYVSWSESVREPEATISRPKQPSVSRFDRADSSKPNWMRNARNDAHARGTQTTRVDNLESTSSVGRIRNSSVAAPQPRVSRSLSYPRRSSSPHKVNLVDRAAKYRSTESVASPSTLPPIASTRAINDLSSKKADYSATLRARETPHETAHTVLRQPNGNAEVERTFSDGVQQTSSDLENVIRRCDYSVLEREWAAQQPEKDFTRTDRGANDMTDRTPMPRTQGEARRRPTVRFSQAETLPPSEVLAYTRPSFYERQAEQQQAALLNQEDFMEMDESGPDRQGMVCAPGAEVYYEQDRDDGGEILYEDGDMLGGFEGLEEAHVSGDRVQRLSSDDGVVARGFWRPNKLY